MKQECHCPTLASKPDSMEIPQDKLKNLWSMRVYAKKVWYCPWVHIKCFENTFKWVLLFLSRVCKCQSKSTVSQFGPLQPQNPVHFTGIVCERPTQSAFVWSWRQNRAKFCTFIRKKIQYMCNAFIFSPFYSDTAKSNPRWPPAREGVNTQNVSDVYM